MKRTHSWLWMIALAAAPSVARAADAPPDRIVFDRDVRPILSDNCFKCHGFDPETRKAKLRLDTREGATAVRKGEAAVVPGDVGKSTLIQRITTTDPDEVMPPPDTGKKLTPVQIEVLKKWVEQKAEYSQHWSFIPPQRPAVPQVGGKWGKNEIDAFVLARMNKEAFQPRPEADKVTLIRRATLDLTGLPPTPAEVDAFLADASPDAYEKLVDRLLANPHYGERMAVEWLDAARFADTHGYHIDSGRDMTRWREWVIEAYNSNMGFDRFTVEQIAGDLLPNATLEQKVASGFNRNHMITFEGGAIPEEYHAAYLIDRVNTTSSVWLGLTVQCAQCHDHKYDPITMKDFYSFYAFFNAVPENALDGAKGNAAPFVKAPTRQQQETIASLQSRIAAIDQELLAAKPELDAKQGEWEAAVGKQVVAWTVVENAKVDSSGGAKFKKLDDHSYLASGPSGVKDVYAVTIPGAAGKPLTAIKLEALPDDSFPFKGPGRSANGNAVLTDVKVAVKTGAATKALKLKHATADFAQDGFDVVGTLDGRSATAWAIYPQVGKPHWAIFELESPLTLQPGESLVVSLEFNSIYPNHQFGRIRLSTTDSLTPHGKDAAPGNVAAILAVDAAKRSDAQRADLRKFYRTSVSPELKESREQRQKLQSELVATEAKIRTTMVMAEMPKPRDTFILMRGQYDKKGEKVQPATFSSLPPLPQGAPNNRLGLAQWLTDPNHPLVARVIVNRYWQMYFGHGIVKTPEDFGSQGEFPSHPELLDWLATEFVRTGWDVKRMQRLIVTSATYRQSSAAPRELYAKDPENRLMARGPRLRLQGEFIRDQALAASGLLNREIGGKSVALYQPAGLWEELMSRLDGKNWTAQVFVQDHGSDLYKRSMYTFWKRTSPPPQLLTFDAPDRETCTVKRGRTNTPLQALILMNDPTYVEASRKMAERVIAEAGEADEARIRHAFRLVLARQPKDAEVTVLKRVLQNAREKYQHNPEAAKKLLTIGEAAASGKLNASELAAWSILCSTILNLDEAVTKG